MGCEISRSIAIHSILRGLSTFPWTNLLYHNQFDSVIRFSWQIFALIIRFVATLSAWFVLNQIWPRYKFQTLIASLLFLVFPGFSQHWVAFTHINQEWIPFISYLLSFGFTARELRGDPKKKTVNSIIALLLLIIGIFPTEYFIGLEPLRFLFIWVIIAENTKGFWPRFIRTMKRWWPYVLIWIVDALWLAYYYKSGAYISYGVTATQHMLSIKALLLAFGDAFWKAGFYVWMQVLVLTGQSIIAPTTILTFVLIVLSFLSIAFYILHLDLSTPFHLPLFSTKMGEEKEGDLLSPPSSLVSLVSCSAAFHRSPPAFRSRCNPQMTAS